MTALKERDVVTGQREYKTLHERFPLPSSDVSQHCEPPPLLNPQFANANDKIPTVMFSFDFWPRAQRSERPVSQMPSQRGAMTPPPQQPCLLLAVFTLLVSSIWANFITSLP